MNILIVFSILYSLLSLLGEGHFSQRVLFESLESKANKGEEVYNQISFKEVGNQDVWKMKQSHHGPETEDWDEVKIIVYKDTKPYQASYHQLKNGKEIEYKVSCFRCHSGGPRFIRPNYDSQKISLSLRDKMAILKWNLRIKSYGEVRVKENNPFIRKVAFKKKEHEVFHGPVCSKCHYEGGPRSALTKGNVEAIKFLVNQNEMPPWPYSMDKREKRYLQKFIYGF